MDEEEEKDVVHTIVYFLFSAIFRRTTLSTRTAYIERLSIRSRVFCSTRNKYSVTLESMQETQKSIRASVACEQSIAQQQRRKMSRCHPFGVIDRSEIGT
jgi:hypothetical protein